jgi:carboxyl-terminal processing protease
MRTKVSVLAALLLLSATAAQAVTTFLIPPLSGHPVFDRAVQLTIDKFYDISALDRFSEAVRREVEDPNSPLSAASSASRVDAAIDKVLSSLGVSHVARFKPDTIDYYETADVFRNSIRRDLRRLFPSGEVVYEGIGMIAKPVDGSLFVSDVYDGLPAARAGVLVGDEVLSVDGAPYHPIASFKLKSGKPVELRLRRSRGAEPIAVKVWVERREPMQLLGQAIADSALVFERDGRKIGYIRFWTPSAQNAMYTVAEALDHGRLKDVDGLVFDLRGRWGGGRSDVAELFLGHTPPLRLIPRSGETELANLRWHKPVIGIIDEGTRSNLEFIAYSLKVNGIPLVGSRTAGALLSAQAYLLPDDSLLELAVKDVVIGDNVRLEGRGVQPDVPVQFGLPYAAGADPQREAAVEEMRRILARR